MKYFKRISLIIISTILIFNNVYSLENKILFKVNNEIITSLDILNELKYLEIINKEFKNIEKEQAFEIAKRSLIREKIKENQLKKTFKEIKLQDQFIKKILIDYFKSIEINSILEFENYFNSINIDPNLIKHKITVEIMWNQLIFKKYNQNVKIDKTKILNNLKKNNKQKEFLLSEILFNVEKNENLNDKFVLIKDKIDKTNFSEAALIYSTSDSASKGGDLGWIKETSISSKIKDSIQSIDVGNYSNPIIIPGGFLILKVKDIREISNNLDLDKEVDVIVKRKTNERLNQLANIFFNKIKKDITINEL